ncbi:universal stress protein [Lysobacter sp. S4-A87]|uniref:universal stress protein n=1 Tax=Lysobacter sp. S4-A87 TaxID=2925843 RepID=UPI001F52C187|nr:universal stress protein [Lysobacter sp. S4-A87]UNK49828.1 universal stress protein [Lysobacter sp. S4-A87]
MIKDLVVPMMNVTGDLAAIDAAAAYAIQWGARLTVIEPVNLPLPTPGPWGIAPSTSMSEIYEVIRSESQVRATKFREHLARQEAPFEVRVVESLFVNPDRTATLHARYADLVVMGGYEEDSPDAPAVRAYFSTLLLESGRPILYVPSTHTVKAPIRRAVVAWRPTREATRALHDALPLLLLAESVDVLEVGPARTDLGDGDQPGADIAAHLARHGLKVRVVIHEQSGEAVTSALLRHCEQAHAQLLVVGGYGHSRFREWVLGGVTRELLQYARLPVLFSH